MAYCIPFEPPWNGGFSCDIGIFSRNSRFLRLNRWTCVTGDLLAGKDLFLALKRRRGSSKFGYFAQGGSLAPFCANLLGEAPMGSLAVLIGVARSAKEFRDQERLSGKSKDSRQSGREVRNEKEDSSENREVGMLENESSRMDFAAFPLVSINSAQISLHFINHILFIFE